MLSFNGFSLLVVVVVVIVTDTFDFFSVGVSAVSIVEEDTERAVLTSLEF